MPFRVFPLLILTGLVSAQEPVALFDPDTDPTGTELGETARLVLEQGRLNASLGDFKLNGSARADFSLDLERRFESPTRQTIQIEDSTHAIAFGFGDSPVSLDPKPSALNGTSATATLTDDTWTLSAEADGSDSQRKALRHLEVYLTILNRHLPELYGETPRSVGDSWKPDIGSIDGLPVPVNAELELNLTALSESRIATIQIQGRLSVGVSDDTTVALAVNGLIERDVELQVDLSTRINGNLSLSGDLGSAFKGPATVGGEVRFESRIEIQQP